MKPAWEKSVWVSSGTISGGQRFVKFSIDMGLTGYQLSMRIDRGKDHVVIATSALGFVSGERNVDELFAVLNEGMTVLRTLGMKERGLVK